jgi:mono/diheme cytochrome c family protein
VKFIRTAISAAAAWLVFAHAASAADAANGERLAKQWCASCHLVAQGQRRASADVPPFSAIARRTGITAESIAYFLLMPHPRMPDMSLTRREAQDIAAYIISLRQ